MRRSIVPICLLGVSIIFAAIAYAPPAFSLFCSTSHSVMNCDCSGRDDCRNMRDKKPCGDDAPVECNEDKTECTCQSTGMRPVPGATIKRPTLQSAPVEPPATGD